MILEVRRGVRTLQKKVTKILRTDVWSPFFIYLTDHKISFFFRIYGSFLIRKIILGFNSANIKQNTML